MLFVPFLQRKKVHDVIAGLTNTLLPNVTAFEYKMQGYKIWELHCLKLQEYLLLKSLEKLMLVYGDGKPSY
ncbi:hypothetical protein Hanom_Chr06g00558911 [Helianthus anomalus]